MSSAPISAAQQRANLEALLLQAQDEYRDNIANFDWSVEKPGKDCLMYTYSAINDLNGNSRLDFPEEITFKNIFTTDEQRLKFGIIYPPWRPIVLITRKTMVNPAPTFTIVNQHTGKVVSRGECSFVHNGNPVQGKGIAHRRTSFLQAAEYTLEFDKQELTPGIYNILYQYTVIGGATGDGGVRSHTFSIIQLPEVPVQPLVPTPVIQNNAPTKSEAVLSDEPNAALKKKLNTLKDMKNAGDITEEEYQLKRKKLLDEF